MGFCVRSTGSAPPRRSYWNMCASSWPRPAAAGSAKLRWRRRPPQPRTTSTSRAPFARLSSSCTLLDGARWKSRSKAAAAERAIERLEETHARHSRSSALARTENRGERRLRQVQARADAVRPLHGGGGRAGLSRHRGSPRAGPAACALEAARRSRLVCPALRHRRIVGTLLVEIPSAGALNVER